MPVQFLTFWQWCEVGVMNVAEYLAVVQEQISNKRAKKLIERELSNHVSEQMEAYKEMGMSEEAAEAESIRQMGDPVKTGYELNRLHKPEMPYGMLSVFVILSVLGTLMQFIIFSITEIQGDYQIKTVCYHIVSMMIVLLMLHVDYSFFVRYSGWLTGAWMLAVWFASQNMEWGKRLMAGYYLMLSFPILVICIFYKRRETGIRGIVQTMLWVWGGFFWNICWSERRLAGAFEAVLTIYVVISIMIACGIYEKKAPIIARVKYLLILWLPTMLFALLIAGSIMGTDSYVADKIYAFFQLEEYGESVGYVSSLIQEWNQNFTIWGNQELFMVLPWALHTDYMVNSIFSYFGIFAGVCVLLLYVGLMVKSFHMSMKQKNRLGYGIGLVCSVCLLIRIVLCVASNFGIVPRFTVSMPFLSYGLANTVTDGIYMGLLCSVFRNTKILPEPDKRLHRPKYEIKIVKNQ